MVDCGTLKPGQTYFSVFYVDEQLRIPSIDTFVYLGASATDATTGPVPVHLFQYADSYFVDGNWNEMSTEAKEGYDEAPVMFFEDAHLEPIFDADGLLNELREWRARL